MNEVDKFLEFDVREALVVLELRKSDGLANQVLSRCALLLISSSENFARRQRTVPISHLVPARAILGRGEVVVEPVLTKLDLKPIRRLTGTIAMDRPQSLAHGVGNALDFVDERSIDARGLARRDTGFLHALCTRDPRRLKLLDVHLESASKLGEFLV